jgi:hypothetical protein
MPAPVFHVPPGPLGMHHRLLYQLQPMPFINDVGSLTFRYPGRGRSIATLSLAMVLLPFLAVMIVAPANNSRSPAQAIQNDLVIGGLLVAVVALWAYTMFLSSDYIVTTDGISRSLWGLTWKKLRWNEIGSIWINTEVPSIYSPQRKITTWRLYRSANPHRVFIGAVAIFFGTNGGIFFRDSVENLNGFLEAINSHIDGRVIRIVDCRRGLPESRDSL